MDTVKVKIDDQSFELLTARTPDEREKGLSGRDSIPKDGMIFFHDHPSRHGYWMKNTSFPLTLMFVDKNRIVQQVVHRDKQSLDITRPDQPALYVIELQQNSELDQLEGKEVHFMDTKEAAAIDSFFSAIKEADIPDPLPEDFLQKILRLPAPQRDKAIQAKMKDFGASVRQQIKNNLSSALADIRKEKIEQQADETLSMVEGDQ